MKYNYMMNKNNSKLKDIKLIVLDVDGTMTDGGISIDNNKIEIKNFNVKDGIGISLAQSVGIEFMILTGRSSNCVEVRAKELNIKYLAQGIKDKAIYLKEFMIKNMFLKENVVYIGDDLNDLQAMYCVGIKVCPIDAVKEIKDYCDYVLPKKGGQGAVRAFIELFLRKNKLWKKAIYNLYSIQLQGQKNEQ
jgi:3-deoxy-D-manno-octulosonate 8-phosphate phosphatase (KDO 8-P phosphatase)